MENDPLLPPPKIWNFPYVSSIFFLKASLIDQRIKSGKIFLHDVVSPLTKYLRGAISAPPHVK